MSKYEDDILQHIKKGKNKMIKIIEHGTRKEQRCEECGCLFSYEEIDVKKGNVVTSAYGTEPYKMPFKYVICPQCNNEIILEAEK